MYINTTIVGGNVVKDIETKVSTNGSIAHFSVAVNRVYHTKTEEVKEVSYFDVVAFGKVADICVKYLKKGSEVIVEGRLKQEKWEAKETKETHSRIVIVAESVHFPAKKE